MAMKEKSRVRASKVGAALLAMTMGLALVPKLTGEKQVRAASFDKNASNTKMGVAGIASPKSPESIDSAWKGSYVWFGKYENQPMKYRVLAPSTTAFGGSTMFLDSDTVLYDGYFDTSSSYSNQWAGSSLQSSLNGTFYTDSFTKSEQAAIATSKVDSHALPTGSFEAFVCGNSVALNDKIFVLDVTEILNPAYGYSSDHGYTTDADWETGNWSYHNVLNHVKFKGASSGFYWMRSKYKADSTAGFGMESLGYMTINGVSSMGGVSPAMNLNLSSILFNSQVSAPDASGAGAEYKLTLLDSSLNLSLVSGLDVSKSGSMVFLPYVISGSDAVAANQVSIIILDKPYMAGNTNGENLLYYMEMNSMSGTTGTGFFLLPDGLDIDGWDSDYFVYAVAEILDDSPSGDHTCDYASAPLRLTNPKIVYSFDVAYGPITLDTAQSMVIGDLLESSLCNVTVNVPDSEWYMDLDKDGKNDIDVMQEGSVLKLSKLSTCSFVGAYTYKSAQLSADPLTSGKYDEITFVVTKQFTVSFDANGGSGSMNPITVFEGSSVTLPDCGFIAPEGMEFDGWDKGAVGSALVVTSNTVVTAQWKLTVYFINVVSDGNGTASASVESGTMGTEVTLTATPNEGYQFKEWTVADDSVVIVDNKFTIGTCNLDIVAHFEPIQANPEPVKDPSFEDFVERLYTVALGRASEPEGKAFWVDQVVNKGFTGADCARFFMLGAPEFLGRNLTDDEFVEVLYKTYFDRNSEPDGKAYWLGRLASGTERAVLVDEFIESVEWCNVCATYGVKSGALYHKATIPSKNAVKFATRLYTCCLGRDPEAEGLQYWSLALTNLDATGYQAASLFFTLPEFVGLNTTNEEFLKRLYTTFMDREPETDGFNYWLGLLNGGTDRVDVMKAFAGCPEFQEICNQYGIERGEI
ncbi:MAG: DUF4214 domain-containing protein [Clostridiales bacterium]|nr:DUF4214 domain-containing protein [Clostridiales bacterium]